MGNRVTRAVACLVPVPHDLDHHRDRVAAMNFPSGDPLDEGFGHSFCYIRPQDPFSPCLSDRFTTTDPRSASFRSTASAAAAVDRENNNYNKDKELWSTSCPSSSSAAAFKSISGASVSANTATNCTLNVSHHHHHHQHSHPFANVPDDRHAAFESSASFASLPLQPVPKGVSFSGPIHGPSLPSSYEPQQHPTCFMSGPIERSLTFGPLDRVFMSGPLERGFMSGPIDNVSVDGHHFSAPISGFYQHRSSGKRRKVAHFFDSVRKPVQGALQSTVSRTRRSIVAPVRRLVWRYRHNGAKEGIGAYDASSEFRYVSSDDDLANLNLQWAQGKAGEDRVHVVVSEDHGWLFVGIYDGFNGPDAPDFLMKKMYRAVYKELRGLLWDVRKAPDESSTLDGCRDGDLPRNVDTARQLECGCVTSEPADDVKDGVLTRSRTLRDFLSDAEAEVGDKASRISSSRSGGHTVDRFAMDLKKASRLAGSDGDGSRSQRVSTRWKTAKTLMKPISLRRRIGLDKKFPSKRIGNPTESAEPEKNDSNQWESKLFRCGAVDHDAVLRALGRALEATEQAYLALSDLALEENPELALMGSCILVALMKDRDVYVLNVGDSRAIVAQERNEHPSLSSVNLEPVKIGGGARNTTNRQDLERISEESPVTAGVSRFGSTMDPSFPDSSLIAVQLSTDHSTSIEEEVCRIRAEHPDDETCILNDRVKGRLKVTRAFGAGFLKKPRWNSAILKMFQIEYVGSAAYISCTPALCHHRLGPNDRFLILSSDGLYQYFSNQEVVSYVEWFMEKFPEGDPAQFLIEELLFRAAKKAGLDFHELLDIPQGDRRKYHDDVSVMVIAIDGRIWRSSG